MTNPLCSFLMITYNQEKYITKALESALSQNVSELEIVICDDASSDRTFEIATRIAKNYSGPFTLILHRNEHNLGIGPNFQKARSLAHGDWLFMAAGDDASLPNRCQTVMDAISSFPNAAAFCSNYQVMDENDAIHGFFSPDFPVAPGAVFCWHKDIFDVFPPLDADLKLEDFPLLTRVFALNRDIVKLPQSTLLYRIDGHSFTGQGRNSAAAIKHYQQKLTCIQRICTLRRISDLRHAIGKGLDGPLADALIDRQKCILKAMDIDLLNIGYALQALEGSCWKRLQYLLSPSSLALHRKLSSRIRTVLAGMPLLRMLKQRLHPYHDSLPVFTRQHLIQSLPLNLEPVVISPQFYLDCTKADFYVPLDETAYEELASSNQAPVKNAPH